MILKLTKKLCWFLLLFSSLVLAMEFAGVKMPDQITVGNKKLVLNGMGLRTVTFLKVKVYVAGLYLESKLNNAEEIMKSSSLKHLVLYFTRDVDAEKLRDVWNESFNKNCKSQCESLRPTLEKLNSEMKDMKKGEQISFTFFPSSLRISTQGRKPIEITNTDFSKILLSIWLGPEPPNEDLKRGLLGQLKK